MKLKEELAEKLASIDCKETIKNVLDERKDDIKEALYLDRKDKGVFDAVQEKVISRKLLVFAVATGLLYWGTGLDAETWGMMPCPILVVKPQSTLQKSGGADARLAKEKMGIGACRFGRHHCFFLGSSW